MVKSVQMLDDNWIIKNNPQLRFFYPRLYKEIVEHDRVSHSSWYDLSEKAYEEYRNYLEEGEE